MGKIELQKSSGNKEAAPHDIKINPLAGKRLFGSIADAAGKVQEVVRKPVKSPEEVHRNGLIIIPPKTPRVSSQKKET